MIITKKKKLTNASISLSEDLKEDLRQIAKSEGITLSSLCNFILEDFVKNKKES